jgi:hypothetical protein
MVDYVTLLGAEQVQSAASTMRSAADEMRSAASCMSEALDAHRRAMDEWLERFERIMAQRPNDTSNIRDGCM